MRERKDDLEVIWVRLALGENSPRWGRERRHIKLIVCSDSTIDH